MQEVYVTLMVWRCVHMDSLDSGAQVTTLEESWLEKHLPDARWPSQYPSGQRNRL